MASKQLKEATSFFKVLSSQFSLRKVSHVETSRFQKKGRTNKRTNKGEESIISSEISLFANQVLFIWQALCRLDCVLWFGLSFCQKGKLPGKQWSKQPKSSSHPTTVLLACSWRYWKRAQPFKGAGVNSSDELGQRSSSMQQQASLRLGRWRLCLHIPSLWRQFQSNSWN